MPASAPNRVRAYRERAGLRQAELAERIGMTRQALCRLEGGAWSPNTAAALRLARCLGTTVEELFGSEGAPAGAAPRDPQSPQARRLLFARIGDRQCAFAADTAAALEPAFLPADAWSHAAPPADAAPPTSTTAVLQGCDPAFGILAGLVTTPTQRLLFRFASSADAVQQLLAGRAHLAGIHLVTDDSVAAAVESELQRKLPHGGSVITFARWEQGLMLAAGNPLGVRGVDDLVRPGLRFLNRAPGSGCRVQFDALLRRRRIPRAAVPGYDRVAPSHWSTAHAIALGAADAGLGLRAVAESAGLAFVPLAAVRCDLVIPAELEPHPAVEAVLQTLQRRRLRAELDALPGYDASETGRLAARLPAA